MGCSGPLWFAFCHYKLLSKYNADEVADWEKLVNSIKIVNLRHDLIFDPAQYKNVFLYARDAYEYACAMPSRYCSVCVSDALSHKYR